MDGRLKTTAIATPDEQARAGAGRNPAPRGQRHDRQERREPARDGLPWTIGRHEPEDPRQPMREIDPRRMVRRPSVAAELSERGRSPGEETDDEQARHAGEDPRRRPQVWLGHTAGDRMYAQNRGQHHDAVFLDHERRGGEDEERQPPHQGPRPHSMPPQEGTEDDERLDQVHLIRDPRHERVRHRRMGDDQQRRGGGRERAAGQAKREPARQAGGDGEQGEGDSVMGRRIEAEQLESDGVEDNRQRPVELDHDAAEVPRAVERGEHLGEGVGAKEIVIVVIEAVVQRFMMDEPGRDSRQHDPDQPDPDRPDDARCGERASSQESAWQSSAAAGLRCPRRSGRFWRRETASRPGNP